MKKGIVGIIVALMLLVSSTAFAAVKVNLEGIRLGVQGYITGGSVFNTGPLAATGLANPLLGIVDIGDEFQVVFGYGYSGNGKDLDADTALVIGGTWYPLVSNGFRIGPTVGFVTGITADTAKNNNLTIFSIGASAQKTLVKGIDLKADANILNLVSGKQNGVKLEDTNEMFTGVSLSVILYLL